MGRAPLSSFENIQKKFLMIFVNEKFGTKIVHSNFSAATCECDFLSQFIKQFALGIVSIEVNKPLYF